MSKFGGSVFGRVNLGVRGGRFRIDLKVRRRNHAAFVFIVRVGVGVVRGVEGHFQGECSATILIFPESNYGYLREMRRRRHQIEGAGAKANKMRAVMRRLLYRLRRGQAAGK